MKFQLLRLLLLFKFKLLIVLSCIPFGVNSLYANNSSEYSDAAYMRFENSVILRSQADLTLSRLMYLNCLFGNSVFYGSFVNDRSRVKRFYQLSAYLRDKSFEIPEVVYKQFGSKLKKNSCKEMDLSKFLKNKNFLNIEVFLQEAYLGIAKKDQKSVWRNLKKVLDSRYPVVLYEN
jgi:hypothetical protein